MTWWIWCIHVGTTEIHFYIKSPNTNCITNLLGTPSRWSSLHGGYNAPCSFNHLLIWAVSCGVAALQLFIIHNLSKLIHINGIGKLLGTPLMITQYSSSSLQTASLMTIKINQHFLQINVLILMKGRLFAGLLYYWINCQLSVFQPTFVNTPSDRTCSCLMLVCVQQDVCFSTFTHGRGFEDVSAASVRHELGSVQLHHSALRLVVQCHWERNVSKKNIIYLLKVPQPPSKHDIYPFSDYLNIEKETTEDANQSNVALYLLH